MQAIIASAIGFLAILGLTAIVSAIKAPKLLDDARRSKIGNLNDENQAFRSKPKRTSVEEHHYTVAKAALDDLGPDGTIVLRHLEKHGTLKFNGLDPPVPKGMNARDTKAILDICVSEDLATREAVSKSSGGTYAVVEHTYRIAPGMKTALDELLYSPSRANGQ